MSIYLVFFALWGLAAQALLSASGDLMIGGVMLFCIGACVRLSAINRLREKYVGEIIVEPGMMLVTSGIYAIVRHPLHLGLLLELIGCSVICFNVVSIVLLGIGAAVISRLNQIEDALFMSYCSPSMQHYLKTVPAMCPRAISVALRIQLVVRKRNIE